MRAEMINISIIRFMRVYKKYRKWNSKRIKIFTDSLPPSEFAKLSKKTKVEVLEIAGY